MTTPLANSQVIGRLQTSSRAAMISEYLQGMINRGQLAAGHRLPTERDLATQFGVSVLTVNKAMAVMEAHGYLVRRVGVGTTVAPEAGRGTIALSFHQNLVENGPLFYRALITRLADRIAAEGFQADLILAPWNGQGGVDRGPLIRSLTRGRMVGVVTLGWAPELIAPLSERGLAMTHIESSPEGDGGFFLDYENLLTQALEHLTARGHRHIALFTPHNAEHDCPQAFQRLAAAQGLAVTVKTGLSNELAAAAALQQLVRATPGSHALIIGDEALLSGVATAAAVLGLRLPTDLAVVTHASLGLDDVRLRGFTCCGFRVDRIAELVADQIFILVQKGEFLASTRTAIGAELVPGSTS
jgi:DNA-binding LacI/PurR family transcriptional regulator